MLDVSEDLLKEIAGRSEIISNITFVLLNRL